MTLDLEPQGALDRATSTARAAFHTRLLEAGWPAEVADGLARVAADIQVPAAWAELKRANRPPMEDGR